MADPLTVRLPSATETERLAEAVAAMTRPGDLLALEGDLGAGKTTFARALIRTLADDPGLDVPSPTFTLVQSYDEARPPATHADLYRIGAPEETAELGLDEAVRSGVLLVEWPEKGRGALPPAEMLRVHLALSGEAEETREATLEGQGSWAPRLARLAAIRRFLDEAGWSGARRIRIQGDASTRSYERLARDGETAILMNSPSQPDGPPIRDGKPYSRIAHLAESVHAFVAIGRALYDAGLSAPAFLATDPDKGLLLLEDLGAEGVVTAHPPRAPVPERYEAAVEVLAAIHARHWPEAFPFDEGTVYRVPPYDLDAFLIEAELLLDWYLPAEPGRVPGEAERARFRELWSRLLAEPLAGPRTLVLRDYHSPNLLWLPQREGLRRVGLLDFQYALIGPDAYDVVSLLQDARVDVPAALEEALLERYLELRIAADAEFDAAAFRRRYAVLGAQRATKILGIFRRLERRDGKPQYLAHLPRIVDNLRRNLAHPVCAPLARWYGEILPQAAGPADAAA
ncbi:MAG: tRNA (adenosine(37)-N6)-threonylcarbamoyltransferase complex ATPase subunit type 1 TsaE [Pseudomonadota bacterium]|nr:tRNA (adenosine(37)-N6)-threonylcarbamoyltransferase complex ATPase subunit type 1 TsaE [Pseudomonadota bacterium]